MKMAYIDYLISITQQTGIRIDIKEHTGSTHLNDITIMKVEFTEKHLFSWTWYNKKIILCNNYQMWLPEQFNDLIWEIMEIYKQTQNSVKLLSFLEWLENLNLEDMK